MVTRADMEAAFGAAELQTLPEQVAERFFDRPADRRVLTEVGLPYGFLEQIVLISDLDPGPRTVGQVLDIGVPGSTPPDIADDLVIANGLGGLACMSRAGGPVYWYSPGGEKEFNRALVNSSLELFAETLCRAQKEFEALFMPSQYEDEASRALIGEELRRLVGEIRDIDPPRSTARSCTGRTCCTTACV